MLNHCSTEAWDVTSEHRGFTFIEFKTRVDLQDVLGVSKIKAGQWPKVEITKSTWIWEWISSASRRASTTFLDLFICLV